VKASLKVQALRGVQGLVTKSVFAEEEQRGRGEERDLAGKKTITKQCAKGPGKTRGKGREGGIKKKKTYLESVWPRLKRRCGLGIHKKRGTTKTGDLEVAQSNGKGEDKIETV